jgi:hypothetical protein
MTSATLSMPATVTVESAPRKRGAFARFIHAITEARMRQAEREIARVRHLLPQIEIGKID